MANTPNIKFESSPTESMADSFSSSDAQYSSLFSDNMDPSQVMTPQSFDDDSMFGDDMEAGSPAPEKKPVKKRKSWGQQLPQPKTNLPPRKRAKTEDEKEQRRVERFLRNRRAAQSSRERKRQEVEALEAENREVERRNQDLEMRLAESEAELALLRRELGQITGNSKMRVFQGTPTAASPAAEQLRAHTPVTFSQELFSSRDEHRSSISTQSIAEATPRTVNPASLSPEIRPVAELSNASSSDMTQHPAVSVGRTTALDELNAYSNLGSTTTHQHDFSSYFGHPDPSESDRQYLDNTVLPLADTFNLDFDHMVGYHNGVLDEFNLDDFLHQHDDQPAPEIQSSDSLVETTAGQQPTFGASSYGCDDVGNAVSV